MDGRPITYYCTKEFDSKFKMHLSKLACDSMLKMVFSDNFVHGDLHPGKCNSTYV